MTPYSHTLTDTDLRVTPPARQQLTKLITDTDGEAAAVRIYVAGGGCSGMTYGMTFAETPLPTDSIMQDNTGLKLVVDPVALSFLSGAEVDYVDDGVNISFIFNNVFQAVGGAGTCGGCGSSA